LQLEEEGVVRRGRCFIGKPNINPGQGEEPGEILAVVLVTAAFVERRRGACCPGIGEKKTEERAGARKAGVNHAPSGRCF